MAGRRIKGDLAFKRLINRLPQAVRFEIAQAMSEAGNEILAAQSSAAPRRTGALASGLTKRVLRGGLRLRIGIATKPVAKRLFYARYVEFGRKAQTVTVSRGAAHVAIGGPRIGRRDRALRAGIKGVYQLHVRAMSARPFVASPQAKAIRETLGGRVSVIWDRALAKAAGGGGDD